MGGQQKPLYSTVTGLKNSFPGVFGRGDTRTPEDLPKLLFENEENQYKPTEPMGKQLQERPPKHNSGRNDPSSESSDSIQPLKHISLQTNCKWVGRLWTFNRINRKIWHLKTRVRRLMTKLKEANDSCRRHKDEQNELQEKWSKLEKDYDKSQKSLKYLQEQYGWVKEERNKARELSNIQNGEIDKLTEAISLSGNRYNTTTRDDDYFETEFSKLAGDIQQWVFRNFRGASNIKLQDFPEPVKMSVESIIWSNQTLGEPQIRLKEIEAVIVDQLARKIISQFPFRIPELKEDLKFVYSFLGGTDLEKRQWRAQTVNMIIGDDGYKYRFLKGLDIMTKYLKACLDIRITVPRENCDQALYTIVKHAAKLSEEVNQQIAYFQVRPIGPGTPYNPKYMQDISGILSDEEREKGDEDQSIIVHKVLFPAVLRYGFNEAGEMVEYPVTVRKAKVIVIHLKDEEEYDFK